MRWTDKYKLPDTRYMDPDIRAKIADLEIDTQNNLVLKPFAGAIYIGTQVTTQQRDPDGLYRQKDLQLTPVGIYQCKDNRPLGRAGIIAAQPWLRYVFGTSSDCITISWDNLTPIQRALAYYTDAAAIIRAIAYMKSWDSTSNATREGLQTSHVYLFRFSAYPLVAEAVLDPSGRVRLGLYAEQNYTDGAVVYYRYASIVPFLNTVCRIVEAEAQATAAWNDDDRYRAQLSAPLYDAWPLHDCLDGWELKDLPTGIIRRPGGQKEAEYYDATATDLRRVVPILQETQMVRGRYDGECGRPT